MVHHYSSIQRVRLSLFFVLLFTVGIVQYVIACSPQSTSSKNVVFDGVNVDITAMIPGTPYTIKTASGGNFFDLAAQIGINTVRITDIRWETTGEEYSGVLWKQVFDEAVQHHMHVILLLTGGGKFSAIYQAQMLLDNYGLASSPALWLVDLYNEPNLSDPQLMTMLREEAAYVHQITPDVPITIGGWKSQDPDHPGKFIWQKPADIPKFINLVNIVSAHLYDFEEAAKQGITPRQWTQSYLQSVRQESMNKPILLEEFGASNGIAPTMQATATGSPIWQAYVYRGVMQEVLAEYDQGIIGAVAWIFAPRPPEPHPSQTNYQGNMTGWAFVLDHGRHLLPAAQAFRRITR